MFSQHLTTLESVMALDRVDRLAEMKRHVITTVLDPNGGVDVIDMCLSPIEFANEYGVLNLTVCFM
jgi:hypothetical protein